MTKITKAIVIAALSFAAGTLYTDSGFALGSDENIAITADDIVINPELVQQSNQQAKEDAIQFVDGTGKFEQEIPSQVNPELGTAEYEAAQEEAQAAEEQSEQSASSLRELVNLQNINTDLSDEMQCLAGTIYFESKGESLAGQLAVAKVVLARVQSSRFPDSICGVVYQRRQFSFVRNGAMPKISTGRKTWHNAKAIAQIAVDDSWDSEVEGALFFHAAYVSPNWKRKRLGRVDKHIFYR